MQTNRTALATPELARPPVRPDAFAADFDDVRRFDYTQGWDEDDADLGWVDVETVRPARRLH